MTAATLVLASASPLARETVEIRFDPRPPVGVACQPSAVLATATRANWVLPFGPLTSSVSVAVISGRVGSVHADAIAKALLEAFARGVKKFRRVRSYYVGPEAERLWQAGYRLTRTALMPPS